MKYLQNNLVFIFEQSRLDLYEQTNDSPWNSLNIQIIRKHPALRYKELNIIIILIIIYFNSICLLVSKRYNSEK